MPNLLSDLIDKYIFAQGGTVQLDDATYSKCGFNDSPTRIVTQEPIDSMSGPPKQPVTFTLPSSASVKPTDTLTYQGVRYVVDRVITHGPADYAITQVAVAYRSQ